MKSRGMAITLSIISVLLIGAAVGHSQTTCTESYGTGPNKFSLATGSPGELGLLKVLGEEFARKNNTTLCWVKPQRRVHEISKRKARGHDHGACPGG